jgi:hypothetical protein
MTESTFENVEPVDIPSFTEPDSKQSKGNSREKVDVRDAMKNFGRKKTASGNAAKPRQLKEDDKVKLEGWYGMLGMAFMPFNARAANACMQNATECADSWFELAKENDNVRRVILGLLEGGAWGKVIMAHMPLAMAFMPGDILDRFNLSQAFDVDEDEVRNETENNPE